MTAVKLEGRLPVVLYQAATGSALCWFWSALGHVVNACALSTRPEALPPSRQTAIGAPQPGAWW